MRVEKILLNILSVQKAGVTCIPKSQSVDYPIISFSGTQNFGQILNYDLNFLPEEWSPKGKAHSGFIKRSLKLIDEIVEAGYYFSILTVYIGLMLAIYFVT